jgi:hypothetical protein
MESTFLMLPQIISENNNKIINLGYILLQNTRYLSPNTRKKNIIIFLLRSLIELTSHQSDYFNNELMAVVEKFQLFQFTDKNSQFD